LEKSARNQMVVENLPLVGYLASEMCAKATHLSREDLASVGAIALLTAADSFNPSLGVPFGAYARRRILGAFADDMRSADWATRGARKRIKETRAVQDTLTSVLGRKPTIAELSEALGVDAETAHAALADAARTVVGIDDVMAEYLVSESETPEQQLLAAERSGMLATAVDVLPEKMRHIVRRIYFGGASVKEVAAELGITHSAVSQQRSEAMQLLRDGLATHYPDTDRTAAPEPTSRIAAQRRNQYITTFGEHAAGGLARAAHAVQHLKPAI
jgi:RNA polymerase sigma factor for flagellar operon FliA